MREESIVVSDSNGGCVLTVLHVRGGQVSMLVSHSSVEQPGVLNTWTATLTGNDSFKVGSIAQVTVVDVRAEKARIGINASKSAAVHRLEVWEAIRRTRRPASGGDAEDGLSGSPAPRPSAPPPPSLDARLDEPPPSGGGGDQSHQS
jgi:carbon storage regulator CsrA